MSCRSAARNSLGSSPPPPSFQFRQAQRRYGTGVVQIRPARRRQSVSMRKRSDRGPRSALRPMVVGAAVLASIVAVGSVVLAWSGPRSVAKAVAEDASDAAVKEAKSAAHDSAFIASTHLSRVLSRAETIATRIACEVKNQS